MEASLSTRSNNPVVQIYSAMPLRLDEAMTNRGWLDAGHEEMAIIWLKNPRFLLLFYHVVSWLF
jgi:hypothetical protein